ncbi:conserved hypothetical protein [Nostocoides japonicum T1-X7]|uniref:Bacterial proteasome activator n=1 Tax=Nostocoides japonicum T1-X7 TaxID=1194083 RepID=A0A077M3N0_9MICO|nr:bacterial proteasome activator family protein [Tetrasphaera japonica]CCH80431.1 conserved hypothetical protein [Tetrasphaera japonica T1-X7]
MSEENEEQQRAVPMTVTNDGERIVVVTPDGMGVAAHPDGATGEAGGGADEHQPAREERRETSPADLVEQPAKVMRIGSMIKQLLEEVRNAPLDEKGRARLAEIHERSIGELKDGLAPELVDELDRIALPFKDESPSDAELRIAQAQLVGWLEGLFHGIQTALVAQQMAAQAQLQEMRRALPMSPHVMPGQVGPDGPGVQGHPGMPQPGQRPGERGGEGTGQYL